jgi:hypothetical protein
MIKVTSKTGVLRDCKVIRPMDEGQMIKIHYEDFDEQYDEWIDETSDRIDAKYRAKLNAYR